MNNIDKDLKIIVDCAYGSASETAPFLFEKLGLNAEIMNYKYDYEDGVLKREYFYEKGVLTSYEEHIEENGNHIFIRTYVDETGTPTKSETYNEYGYKEIEVYFDEIGEVKDYYTYEYNGDWLIERRDYKNAAGDTLWFNTYEYDENFFSRGLRTYEALGMFNIEGQIKVAQLKFKRWC